MAGLQISDFQRKLMFANNEQVMACCGRGSGKTSGVTGRIAYRNVEFGRSSMLIAPTFGMIKDTIMPDVLEWFEKFRVKATPNWSEHLIETRYGRVILLSGTRPDSPRGYTNFEDFYGDEAAYLSKSVITNGILACRSNKGLSSTQCLTSTGRVGSYFNKIFKKPNVTDYLRLSASTFDNPFTTEQYRRLVYESLKDTPELLEQELWGGLDAEELNLVFPPSIMPRVCMVSKGRNYCGIDFAYEGNDCTTITVTNDSRLVDYKEIGKDNGRKAFDTFVSMHKKYDFASVTKDHTGGFDQGFSVLMESSGLDKKIPQINVNFGGASPDPKYENMRAYIYFNGRKRIKDEGFYVGLDEFDDELIPQTYFVNKAGKIQLTPKKLIKAQIGKSPDRADSLMLSMYHPIDSITLRRVTEHTADDDNYSRRF